MPFAESGRTEVDESLARPEEREQACVSTRAKVRPGMGKVEIMFDNVAVLIGAYGAMTVGLSIAIAKISPTIGPRMRHLFSGVAPLAVVLGTRTLATESVTLQGMGLFAAGGLVVFGVVASNAVGKFVPIGTAKDSRRLT
jgi:hypothetical protein